MVDTPLNSKDLDNSAKLINDCVTAFGGSLAYDVTGSATISMEVRTQELDSNAANALRAWLVSANTYGLTSKMQEESTKKTADDKRLITIPVELNFAKIENQKEFFDASLALQRCVNLQNRYASLSQFMEALPQNQRATIKEKSEDKAKLPASHTSSIVAQHNANGIAFLTTEVRDNLNQHDNNALLNVVKEVAQENLLPYFDVGGDGTRKNYADIQLQEKSKFIAGFNKLEDKSFPEKKVFLLQLKNLVADPYWDKLGKVIKIGKFGLFDKTSSSTTFLRQQLNRIDQSADVKKINEVFDVIQNYMEKKNAEKVPRHPALDALFKDVGQQMQQIKPVVVTAGRQYVQAPLR